MSMVDELRQAASPQVQPPDSETKPTPETEPTQPAASPEQNVGDQAAPETKSDSPAPTVEEVAKRLQDTQRWGHQKAAEAAQLKAQLAALYNHPIIQEAIKKLSGDTQTPQPDPEVEELRKAWADYQQSGSDEEAFMKLVKIAESRAEAKATKKIEQTLTERQKAEQAKQQHMTAARAIEDTVKKVAPNVPVKLFWAYSEQAEAETPRELVGTLEGLAWQVDRAIALAKADLSPAESTATPATGTSQVKTQLSAVLSSGSETPKPAANQNTAPAVNFVDQIKALQARRVTS